MDDKLSGRSWTGIIYDDPIPAAGLDSGQRIARLELLVRELLRVTNVDNVIGPSMAPARELIADVDRVPVRR